MAASAMAQTSPTQTAPDFANLPIPTVAAIRDLLVDKSLKAHYSNGVIWRFQIKSNGYYFANTPTTNFSGTWRIEDGGKLCFEYKTDQNCTDARIVDGVVVAGAPAARGGYVRYVAE